MSKRLLYRWATALTTGIALLAALSGSLAWADDDPIAPPAKIDIVRVYYSDRTHRNQLLLSFKAQLLETHYEDGYHVMQLTAHEIEQLTRMGIRVQADPQWTPLHTPETTELSTQASGIPGYPCYRTVEETFSTAQQIAQDHPQLATWEDVGDSWEKRAGLGGYDIMALRLTHRDVPGPKPTLFVNAAIHAREYTTAELVTRFAETLVENYGTDADVTWILDHHQVHMILQANPDGRKQAEAGRSWRKNTNLAYCTGWSSGRGADLNRNFDFQWNCCGGSSNDECAWDYHGPAAVSEPETQALQSHIAAIFPDQRGPELQDAAPDDATGILIDVHSYGELLLWPWNFSNRIAPNAAQLQTLGRKLAYWNGYTPQQAIGLYPADGASDDYAYGQFGVAAYTIELGTRFFQSCDDFEATILPDNLPTLLYAAKAARAPYRIPFGPDSIQLALSDQAVPAGTPVTLRATIDDTRFNHGNGSEPAQDIVAAEWYVDKPPWGAGAQAMTLTASDGHWDSRIEKVEAILDTTGWSQGRHTLFVRGQDADGNWGATSALYLTMVDTPQQQIFLPYIHTSAPEH